MRIVIAPDSFKDALSAHAAAQAIAQGVARALPDAETVICPLGDGGEGTLAAMLVAANATQRSCEVNDALMRPKTAHWGLIEDARGRSAIIELAEACGLQDIAPAERDARVTTTYGVGQLMLAALDEGVEKFMLTLGGSATNDAGSGMLAALGARFMNEHGNPLPAGGLALADLATLDLEGLDPRLAQVQIEAAVDVDNPLLGERGASAVFGPQKGATPQVVEELDRALWHFADVTAATLGQDYRDQPGTGAAGGMGFAAHAFFNATLRPGIELVTERLGFSEILAGADLLIVGEGGLDAQSLGGKTPVGAARLARQQNIPCVALVGKLGPGWKDAHHEGITAAFALAEGPSRLEEALAMTAQALTSRSEEIMRLFTAAQGLSFSS